MHRHPDKIDLKIAEMEAKTVAEIRREIVRERLDDCRTAQPWCPYLRSVRLCPSIRETLRVEVPTILREMSEEN